MRSAKTLAFRLSGSVDLTQWHQPDHMQIICTTSIQIKRQYPITQFLWAGRSFWHPTNSVKVLKAQRKIST